MPDVDQSIAASGKVQSVPDVIGPISSLAQMSYWAAQGQKASADAAKANQDVVAGQSLLDAKRKAYSDIQSGVAPEEATRALTVYDPTGTNATLANLKQSNDLAANRGYAKANPDNPLAVAGPAAVNAGLEPAKTQAGIDQQNLANKQSQTQLYGQVGTMMASDPSPAGRAQAAAFAKRAGVDDNTINQFMAMPDDQYVLAGKHFQQAALTPEKYMEVSGEAARNKGIAEAQTYIKPIDAGQKLAQGALAHAAYFGDGLPSAMNSAAPPSMSLPGVANAPGTPGAPSAATGPSLAAPAPAPAAAPQVRPQGAMPAVPPVAPRAAVAAPAGPAGPNSPVQVGTGDAAGLIKHFEGYRSQPYWDVNHWRVGYGSDTITNADGTSSPVTAFTTTTPQDAERDLQKRVQSSQSAIQSQVGPNVWNGLSPNVKASLTSVAYNYGSLPASIAKAAQTGDPNVIAAAVRSLPANPGRRASEAGNILGKFAMPQGGGAPQAGPNPGIPGIGNIGGVVPPLAVSPPAGLPQGSPSPQAPANPQGNGQPPASPPVALQGQPPAPASNVLPAGNLAPTGTPADATRPLIQPGQSTPTAAQNRLGYEPVTSGASKVAIAEQEAQGQAYGKLPEQYAAAAGAAKNTNLTLDEMSNAADGSWRQGKWADKEQGAREGLQAVAKTLGIASPDLDKSVASYQDFVKLAGNVSRQAAHETSSRVGVQEMQLINKSLPNPEMSEGGFKVVASQLKGLNDFAIAKQQAASIFRRANGGSLGPANGNGPDFEETWNNSASPAAFVAHRLYSENPQQFQAMVKNMSGAPGGATALKNLKAQMQWADMNGLFRE